jgi:hypothetical protein
VPAKGVVPTHDQRIGGPYIIQLEFGVGFGLLPRFEPTYHIYLWWDRTPGKPRIKLDEACSSHRSASSDQDWQSTANPTSRRTTPGNTSERSPRT